jgi:hypothetical protein
VHLLQPRPGLHAQFPHEQIAGTPVGSQSVDPPAAPVQRGHQQLDQLLPGRVPLDGDREFGGGVLVPAGVQLRLRPQLDREQAQLIQARAHPAAQLVIGHVGQQRAAPQGQRRVEQRHPVRRVGQPLRPRDRRGEPVCVDGVPGDVREVPAADRGDPDPVWGEAGP